MPISKDMGFLKPTISTATKASINYEKKRQERAKGKKTDELKMPSRSAHVSSTGDNERAKNGTNTSVRVVSKPPKPPSSNKTKVTTTTSSTREKSDSSISTSTFNIDIQDQSLSSQSHSKLPRWEKVDEESICKLEKGVRSLSIDDRKTLVMPTSQERTHNESTSSLQADMLFSRSLSCYDERKTESAELERYDEMSSPSNLKLTRSLSNKESSSFLQKPSDRSASSFERSVDHLSGFDAPRSSNARTGSYQHTSATQEPDLRDNLDFYQGKIKSKPVPGHFIKEMLKWKGDYDTLEWNHQYIQWLFPIPEGRGLNRYAQQLTEYEAEEIKRDDKASKRVLDAYKMMLDFYGMRLADENVGTVTRSKTNWEERYAHLNRSGHNRLRITRIIKSIGELGFERFQFQWVNFLFEESVVNKTLPNLNKSCFYHWIDAIHDGPEKEIIYRRMHGLPVENERSQLQDTNSETDEEEDIGTSKTRDVLEKGATGTSCTPKEVPLKTEQKTNTPDDFVSEPLSENDLKRLSAHKDFSDREVSKDGKNVERRYTALGDKYDAEDDDIHRASASENDLKRLSAHKKFSNREVPKDGENVERRYTALGDKYDAEDDDIHGASASENDLKRLSAHKDFSDREVPKDGENVERRCTALGDKYDAEDDDIHGASVRKKTEGKEKNINFPCDNLKFYRNEIQSRPPPGFIIETFLQHAGNYHFLDHYPYFIQWLFPIPTKSRVNEEAQPLNAHEAEAIINDDLAFKRVYRAYVLILDYYGMQIVDNVTGKLEKSKNWKSRWKDLNGSDNQEFRRITRILTSLGQLSYERFQVPLIEILIEDGRQSNTYIQGLNWDHVTHWINCIKDEGEKQAMYEKYKHLIFGSSKSEREGKYDELVGPHCPSIEEYLQYFSTV